MTTESRHQRVESIFLECLDLPQADRRAHLERRCGGDAALREEILDLLAREGRGDSAPLPRLITPAEAPAPSPRPAPTPPASIGPYTLHELLGEGGFGEVYAAEQLSPVRRRVAIKILKAGMDSKAVLARFEAERQALALMDHPGIAKVHDAGVTEAGRPYFVMELVGGESIAAFSDGRSLATRARLDLFADVCRAVEHAHQKGVIHRDLKPSNILVTEEGGKPRPRVIDFGIAKATGAAIAGETIHTRAGDFLGTPEYMSPEQASSGGLDVDTRSDVYSLGVVLYRLLTGRLPFEPQRLRKAGIAEVQRVLREEEPPRPSDVVRSAARGTGDGTAGARELRGDLDWIVARAMEKERDRRYASAAALADDVERHLRNEPVQAGPPGAAYRARKLFRRHRALVGGAAAVIVALVAGLATTMTQAARARRAEGDARRQAGVATAANAFLTGMLSDANPEQNPRGSQVTLREMVDRAARELEDRPIAQPEVEAAVRHMLGSTYMGLGLTDEAEPHILRAVALRSETAGPRDPETLESRVAAAELAMRRGHYPAAESQLAAIGPDVEGLPPSGVQIRTRFLLSHGANLSSMGSYDAADSLLSAVVAIRRGQGAERETELAQSLTELSRVREHRGLYPESEALAREAYEIFRRAHREDHAELADGASRLALVLGKQGRHAEAESLLREATRINEHVLGPDHRSTVMTLNNLGGVLRDMGRLDEAVACQRDALDRLYRSMGRDNPEVAIAQDGFAQTLQQVGRLEEARALYLSSLETQKKAYGPVHPSVARSLNNLGALYRLMGRSEDAAAVFEEALAAFKQIHGEEHPDIATATNNLGKALLDVGRAKEAEPLFAEAVSLGGRVFPPGHPTVAIFRSNRGLALAALGRREEAEFELLSAYDTVRAGLGGDHPRVRQLAGDIADFYKKNWPHHDAERQWRSWSEHGSSHLRS